MFAAEVEFKSYVLVDGVEQDVIVAGIVDVEPDRCSNPAITGVYASDGNEIALNRIHIANLRTAEQELLAVFSHKIDFNFKQYLEDVAEAWWADQRAKAE